MPPTPKPRLKSGQLIELVLTLLRDHPDRDFTSYKVATALGRSRGTVHRILQRHAVRGTVTRTQDDPARFRITT